VVNWSLRSSKEHLNMWSTLWAGVWPRGLVALFFFFLQIHRNFRVLLNKYPTMMACTTHKKCCIRGTCIKSLELTSNYIKIIINELNLSFLFLFDDGVGGFIGYVLVFFLIVGQVELIIDSSCFFYSTLKDNFSITPVCGSDLKRRFDRTFRCL
jgi:hypothetical protein